MFMRFDTKKKDVRDEQGMMVKKAIKKLVSLKKPIQEESLKMNNLDIEPIIEDDITEEQEKFIKKIMKESNLLLNFDEETT
jgi:hypothetical protein